MLLQIDKIDHVIQDLLSYAKPKEMNLLPANPNACAEAAINLAKPQIKDKDIRFKFKGLDNNDRAIIDVDKIQEVLLNLMLNSIAAIKNKGTISVDIHKAENNLIEIVFADDGSGIKKEHLSQVFNPFFTTRKKGTGLGLSICKRIIDAHKGSIEVSSVEGKETVFTICLPLAEKIR